MTFVDSSAWFAATFEGDRHNAVAKQLLRETTGLLTTDHVLVETWLLVNSRFGHRRAEDFWRRFRGFPIQIEMVTLADIDNAWRIAGVFADQTFSIVDCTSFVSMERLGLSRVISFDNDFAIYRYGPARDRAFEVLR